MNGLNSPSPPKFALQKGDHSQEAVAVHQTATLEGHKIQYFQSPKDVPADFIPCGSVEWCLSILGVDVVPDYYPNFLADHLHRKIWKSDDWPLGERIFIKPADKYKRFNGFVTNKGYKGKKRGPYWCSEAVDFENEWRYYISHGVVLASGWYWGDEEKQPEPPDLQMAFPESYCGAVDFGTLRGHPDTLTLVEANHPFACGWYGADHKAYTQWIVDGWTYMTSGQ